MKALVVYLCNSLFSKHLLLRRECIACLRQLAQRHPHELAGLLILLLSRILNIIQQWIAYFVNLVLLFSTILNISQHIFWKNCHPLCYCILLMSIVEVCNKCKNLVINMLITNYSNIQVPSITWICTNPFCRSPRKRRPVPSLSGDGDAGPGTGCDSVRPHQGGGVSHSRGCRGWEPPQVVEFM